MMFNRVLVMGVLVLGGCVVDKQLGNTDGLDDGADGVAGSEGTSTGGDEGGTLGMSGGQADSGGLDPSASDGGPGSVSMTTMATATDEGGSEDTGPQAIQHPACADPFPEDSPPTLPDVELDPTGRPVFTQWQDLACDDPDVLAVETCVDGNECNGGGCLFAGGDAGVCTFSDVDVWCDGEGEVIPFGDGGCWMCSPDEVHAAACCSFPDAFDCRPWPYEADGAPGDACASHEHCEPGLVCSDPYEGGYGICACPGVVPQIPSGCVG